MRFRAILALTAALAASTWCHGQTEPLQGSDLDRRPSGERETRKHAVKRYEIGQGPRSFWLFEPDKPRPERAGVVVFLHGWFAVNPAFYGAWIDHLVSNGLVVVFPRYQNDVGTQPQDFYPNTVTAVRDAFGVLNGGVGHVRPAPGRYAIVGHSAGGNLAAQIAAASTDPKTELPRPRAVVIAMPGEVIPMREPSLDRIHPSTLMLVMVGDEDLVVGDLRGRRIFEEASAVPRTHKRFVLLRSDRHGYPPIVAEHAAPTGVNRRLDNGEGFFRSLQMSFGDINALDRAAFWKMTDMTLAAAFAGKTMDDATADLERFRHLGFWSDGLRVTPPIVSDSLATIPRVIPVNGIRIFPWSSSTRSRIATGPASEAVEK